MKATTIADLLPDYKFNLEELSKIKGGGGTPSGPDDQTVPKDPPHVCSSNICSTARETHIKECGTSSCINQS